MLPWEKRLRVCFLKSYHEYDKVRRRVEAKETILARLEETEEREKRKKNSKNRGETRWQMEPDLGNCRKGQKDNA